MFDRAHSRMQSRQKVWLQFSGVPVGPCIDPRQMAHGSLEERSPSLALCCRLTSSSELESILLDALRTPLLISASLSDSSVNSFSSPDSVKKRKLGHWNKSGAIFILMLIISHSYCNFH